MQPLGQGQIGQLSNGYPETSPRMIMVATRSTPTRLAHLLRQAVRFTDCCWSFARSARVWRQYHPGTQEWNDSSGLILITVTFLQVLQFTTISLHSCSSKSSSLLRMLTTETLLLVFTENTLHGKENGRESGSERESHFQIRALVVPQQQETKFKLSASNVLSLQMINCINTKMHRRTIERWVARWCSKYVTY